MWRRLAVRVLLDDQPELGPDACGRGGCFGMNSRGPTVERGSNPVGGGQQHHQYQRKRWHRGGGGHCGERLSVTAVDVVEAFQTAWQTLAASYLCAENGRQYFG